MYNTQPNRLAKPGEHAARARLEALLEQVDRLSPADLNSAPVPHPDPEQRDALIESLELAADRAGRGDLLDEARDAVREALLRRFVDQWPTRPYGSAYHTVSRTDDQASVISAIEDAVAVAVMEDLLDPVDAAILGEPGLLVLGGAGDLGLLLAGDRDGVPDGVELVPAGLQPDGAPSAADWAAAAHGATAVSPGESYPAQRPIMRLGLVLAGICGALMALGWAVAEDQPVLGILFAVAVVAVCFTLATYRRPGDDR